MHLIGLGREYIIVTDQYSTGDYLTVMWLYSLSFVMKVDICFVITALIRHCWLLAGDACICFNFETRLSEHIHGRQY